MPNGTSTSFSLIAVPQQKRSVYFVTRHVFNPRRVQEIRTEPFQSNEDRYAHRLSRSRDGPARQFLRHVRQALRSAAHLAGAHGAGACARLPRSGLQARRSVGLSSFQRLFSRTCSALLARRKFSATTQPFICGASRSWWPRISSSVLRITFSSFGGPHAP